MQERRNSIANALELRLSCTNPWIYATHHTSVLPKPPYLLSCHMSCREVNWHQSGLGCQHGITPSYFISLASNGSHSSRDHFVYALSQWKMMLQCNVISHWLGAYTIWSLQQISHTGIKGNGCKYQDFILHRGITLQSFNVRSKKLKQMFMIALFIWMIYQSLTVLIYHGIKLNMAYNTRIMP